MSEKKEKENKKLKELKKKLEEEIEHKAHEAKCRQCGKCCYKKTWIAPGILVFTTEHCEYLDPETNKCTVYPIRHQVKPTCCDIETAIKYRALPADCPYVADNPDYEAPIELDKL